MLNKNWNSFWNQVYKVKYTSVACVNVACIVNESLYYTLVNESLYYTLVNESLYYTLVNESLYYTLVNESLYYTLVNESLYYTLVNESLYYTLVFMHGNNGVCFASIHSVLKK